VTTKNEPKKPARNPGHIVLAKNRPAFRIVEQLPRQKDELELAIGRKFIGAYRRLESVQLEGIARGGEPFDLICRAPDGQFVGIQVVEVINQSLRELRDMRSSYRDALVKILGDDLCRFSGCRVSLCDTGDSPYLPNVSSADGRANLHLLADHIRSVGSDIHNLEIKKIMRRDTKIAKPERSVSLLVERFRPVNGSMPLEFSWSGGGPAYRVDLPRGLLPVAIQSKIDKRYAKPASARFVLLAYSVDTYFTKDDPDITESRRLLESSHHSFDDVWFLYPYAERESGALVRVWARNDDG
jgi:hypothetical protein